MQDSKKYGLAGFSSDGEGLIIEKWLKSQGSSLDKVISFVYIMAYDVAPRLLPNKQTWT